MNDLNELKQRYSDGYRCIYTEKDTDQSLTMHLKNFREEKIHTMTITDRMEIGEIEDFLNALNEIKKKKGHDCHDL